MLHELSHFDKALLDKEAHELATYLDGPTLIHLEGRRQPALFVSVLMHGNETAGWDAVRTLLRSCHKGEGRYVLPRSLSLFIGNVGAAAQDKRHLEGEPDYNRVWPGSELAYTPEHGLMQQVVDEMSRRGVFASVDVHNNTGINPHYACVNVLDNRYLHLATLFARTVVYFVRPKGVQSQAMGALCPAVILECGKVGQAHGVEHASDYLKACLHLSELPDHPVAEHDIDLFHTVAQVKIPESVSFGFDQDDVDISFASGLDHLNFRELAKGTCLGRLRSGHQARLEVINEQGEDVTDIYLQAEDDELCLRLPVMPSMLTLNRQVIRQDCLCYLMERYHRPD